PEGGRAASVFHDFGARDGKSSSERPGGMAGLEYWRKAATGADVGPLRSILESDKFSAAVQKFVKDRNDETLRNDLLRKIHWDCGKPDLTAHFARNSKSGWS